jgi:DNA polymerase III delta prime subunit
MSSYDFLNLSPIDFESLTRDVLEKHLEIQLEAFGPGMDRGIDLRCSRGKDIIVQCKRYSSYSKLKQSLKTEVAKVKMLKPKQYVISTSVSLSPDRKDEILTMFAPYILDTGDIYGREDLNGLLTKFPAVERSHFKLWLCSTTVLQSILHSQLYNQSKIALDEIKDKIKFYVPNSSYEHALKILKKNRYVIISGIPGIGKTTLAEMLAYNLLANDYEEFINLYSNIDGGFTLIDEERKQVFLFDDFLGSNFLEDEIGINQDKQILTFIKKIQKSENCLLIFTTREYILNQAKAKFESFEREDFIKCILDLSKYTALEKAKILYNHLYFNEIDPAYTAQLLLGRNLMTIVSHKNYSPRIIEYISKKKTWESCEPKQFPAMLLDMLEAPEKVWLYAFQNHISDLARVILFSILSMGDHCRHATLYHQVKEFNRCFDDHYELKINELTFNRALKELENSFITISKAGDQFSIRFHNPSIQDFLVYYLNNNPEAKLHTALSALYLKDLFKLFGVATDQSYSNVKHLTMTPEIQQELPSRIMGDFEHLHYTTEIFGYSVPCTDDTTALKLYLLHRHIPARSDEFNDFITNQIKGILYNKLITNRAVREFCELVAAYFIVSDRIDLNSIILNLADSFWDFTDITALSDLEETFPAQYRQFVESYPEEYEGLFKDAISALSSVDSEDVDELKDNLRELENISDSYGIDTQYNQEEIEAKIKELEYNLRRDELDYDTDYGYDEFEYEPGDSFSSYSFRKEHDETSYPPPRNGSTSEEDDINDLFSTL